MQYRFLSIDDQGMARVVATLESCDYRHLIGKQVDDFAFSFITPLGSEHDNGFSHFFFSKVSVLN
ncbi:MAG: hypothetical protein ACJA2Q_002249 [Pseudohongiellaceae bacterium]|jgi:hypothetical protein